MILKIIILIMIGIVAFEWGKKDKSNYKGKPLKEGK